MDSNLVNLVSRLILLSGGDFFGFADTTAAKRAIELQGGELVSGYPRAISIGIALPGAIVDMLPMRSEPGVAVSYRVHCYEVINTRLDLISSSVAGLLQRHGYRALPLPASERIDDDRICASFSHKMAASLAGLGWIGKSCLLVTPQVGPRARWTTVLTDAPFVAEAERLEDRCGECQVCVETCPVSAFTGRPFNEGEPREARYDARACEFHLTQPAGDDRRVCGMCIYACPFGRRPAPS